MSNTSAPFGVCKLVEIFTPLGSCYIDRCTVGAFIMLFFYWQRYKKYIKIRIKLLTYVKTRDIVLLMKEVKQMPMKPKELIKLLKNNGFQEIGSNGSHRKLYNPQTNKTVIVPYHNKDMKIGTEQGILKQAGLK